MNCYKYCCLSLVGLLLSAHSVVAQETKDLSPHQLDNLKGAVALKKGDLAREYTFKAPKGKTLSNSGNLSAVGGYKVEVYGSAKDLLTEVKNVEPKAFIKGNVIQVGIFGQQNNAEDMVRKLAARGFWARIVTP